MLNAQSYALCVLGACSCTVTALQINDYQQFLADATILQSLIVLQNVIVELRPH